ncbi:hypothetical protein F3Y22_tig00110429pilonHSYRG00531 [Hibiscus syriacus]|uniref:Uncharacterized protein n=1 Tax=Hibiscus syriacus TaxID=106335 RepID=A0A6A3APZ7_HIBSY|nr:hypothetical protein F3Y22_tig00110429pilonHSYRG00531 [Hibiscus syriacus]
MSPMPPPAMQVAGYRAPEETDTRKATQASDAYRTFAVSKYQGGNGGDATKWVELCRENAGAETENVRCSENDKGNLAGKHGEPTIL